MQKNNTSMIDGHWAGAAVAQGAALAVRFHFETQNDKLHASIDFPSWNSIGYPLSNVRYEHPFIHCEIAGVKAPDIFDGQVTEKSIVGELTLWGRAAQVELQRQDAQDNYRQEEIAFCHTEIELAGTLLLPNRSEPYPAIVLIAGSGAQTRDNLRGMADHFVRQGIAALIYDKRGTGSSTGNWQEATFEDFAQDVVAAVNYLRGRTDVHPNLIGLHGTSQGGWIVHLASALLTDIAYIITVSSPAVTPVRQVIYEVTTRVRNKGHSADEIQQAVTLKQKFDDYVRTGHHRQALEAELAHAKAEQWFPAIEDLPYPLPAYERLAWWRTVLDFDPVPYIQQATCPLLAVFGERDVIVDAKESATLLQSLETSRAIRVEVFGRANHGLMVFPEKNEPFRWFGLADHYLDAVTSWVGDVLALDSVE